MTKSRKQKSPDYDAPRRSGQHPASADSHVPQASGELDLRRLLHGLEVHQIELETQNEELRRTRSEAESALKRYSELFDFAPIGYFVLSCEGIIREVNLAGARLLGQERPRLHGQRFQLFVSPPQSAAFSGFLASVIGTNGDDDVTSMASDFLLTRADAQSIDVRITASLLEHATPAVLLATENVTRRRQAETALQEEARHKDEFLATLSHELRNPLAPIKNCLFVLERAKPGSDQAVRARSVIERQTDHLTRIVDDLLDVTRVARGMVRLQRERLELGEFVHRSVDDHRPTFDALGIRLELSLSSEPLWVEADATRMVQVLGNLLGNAVKFTNAGGRVEVTLRREDAMAVLVVRDDGVGIASDMVDHLFQPFRQAPQNLDRTRGGLGLGLAMVRGLIELHAGTVQASSAGLGRGAQFTIRLPLCEGLPMDATSRDEPRPQRHRILVIEDNVDAADSLRDALKLNGHEVAVAYDGHTALSLGRTLHPSVVICDIGLPGMDGYEVARAIRKDDSFKGSCLIALSGYAFPDDLRHARDAGFDHHIAKPVSLERLERLLSSLNPP